MQLHAFDPDLFLREYWQKKPLLIKNPWVSWQNPLDPDELAGLACEEEVESRLITQSYESWNLEHGPLPEARFHALDKKPWTLLVQAVDHHVPQVTELLGAFRFIPNWRIDDVMVSYATDGGGVGPHYDQYDVFLIQGLGTRRWQVGQLCDASTPMLPHDELRLLADFTPTDEWLLEPGDMLYIPPRIAHNGVAVGDDCMTYSIGCRAPSRSELIAQWSEDLLAHMPDDDRYADPHLASQANPGEISPEAITELHAMITATLQDREAFARWFGSFSSTRKYPDMDWHPDAVIDEEELRENLEAGVPLMRNPASRFSFIRQEAGRQGDAVLLFVDGQCYECVAEACALAEQLCASDSIAIDPLWASAEVAQELISSLLNQGSVAFEEEE